MLTALAQVVVFLAVGFVWLIGFVDQGSESPYERWFEIGVGAVGFGVLYLAGAFDVILPILLQGGCGF